MPTDRYEPGTPLACVSCSRRGGLRGMSLELVLRDEHNLPIAFYSSSVFNQVSLPGKPGRYECMPGARALLPGVRRILLRPA